MADGKPGTVQHGGHSAGARGIAAGAFTEYQMRDVIEMQYPALRIAVGGNHAQPAQHRLFAKPFAQTIQVCPCR